MNRSSTISSLTFRRFEVSTFLALALLLVVPLTGCTSKRQAYPNHSPGQVWTAMQAVAESPEYDDWHLTANEVWVDEEQARIEVYREVRRTLHRPRSKPVNQRRTWRLRFVLEDEDPPTVRVVSRGMGVPAHALQEADRYLIDVRRMLQTEYAAAVPHRPEPSPEEADPLAPQPEPRDAQREPAGVVPPVDVDDLD
jgi:hypothetical protein